MGMMEKWMLTGKKAVVTGGASGIGRCAALAFAEMGADVAVLDKNLEGALETVSVLKAFGVKSFAAMMDVSDPESVQRSFNMVEERFDTLEIAFNNVGIGFNSNAEKMEFTDWKRIIDIDLSGAFLVAQAAGRIMLKNGRGSLINTASMSGHIVNFPQCQCGYNAAKAGVLQLTKSLAVEWAQRGVRVNSISPGYMDTPMTKKALQERKAIWASMTPMKRLGKPEELQGAILYLASDAASFTTGCDIVVDGGYTCL